METTTTNSESRLLQRPGEIRNRIYCFVIELFDTFLAPPPYTWRAAGPNPGCVTDWSGLDRKSLGLTQTCRQLRAEFPPIHFKEMKFFINAKDIGSYGEDFVPIVGELVGDLDVHMFVFSYSPGLVSVFSVDLTPLMKLVRANPSLQITFRGHGDWGRYAFQRLISLEQRETWKAFRARYVTEKHYIDDQHLANCVELVVAQEVQTDWMPWTEAEVEKDSESETQGIMWMKGVGLEGVVASSRLKVIVA